MVFTNSYVPVVTDWSQMDLFLQQIYKYNLLQFFTCNTCRGYVHATKHSNNTLTSVSFTGCVEVKRTTLNTICTNRKQKINSTQCKTRMPDHTWYFVIWIRNKSRKTLIILPTYLNVTNIIHEYIYIYIYIYVRGCLYLHICVCIYLHININTIYI
jgi:hypothetical protein